MPCWMLSYGLMIHGMGSPGSTCFCNQTGERRPTNREASETMEGLSGHPLAEEALRVYRLVEAKYPTGISVDDLEYELRVHGVRVASDNHITALRSALNASQKKGTWRRTFDRTGTAVCAGGPTNEGGVTPRGTGMASWRHGTRKNSSTCVAPEPGTWLKGRVPWMPPFSGWCTSRSVDGGSRVLEWRPKDGSTSAVRSASPACASPGRARRRSQRRKMKRHELAGDTLVAANSQPARSGRRIEGERGQR